MSRMAEQRVARAWAVSQLVKFRAQLMYSSKCKKEELLAICYLLQEPTTKNVGTGNEKPLTCRELHAAIRKRIK